MRVVNRLIAFMMVFLLTAAVASAREIGGKNLPETLEAGGRVLYLNGAGLRTKYFVSIYAAGLYLTHPMRDAQKIMDADEPMAVRMHMMTGLMTPGMMADALQESLEEVAGEDFETIRERTEAFIRAQDVKVGDDDICDYVYVPEEGLSVYINGERKAVLEGLDFKRAVFGMWLSDTPCDKALKRDFLGD
jgi:hypothetical protein